MSNPTIERMAKAMYESDLGASIKWDALEWVRKDRWVQRAEIALRALVDGLTNDDWTEAWDKYGIGKGMVQDCLRTLLPKPVDPMRAIVDKLPKTADGVPVTPGMTVFPPCGCNAALVAECFQPVEVKPVSCWCNLCKQEEFGSNDYYDTSPTKYDIEECFSTHEAAKRKLDAARKDGAA